MSCVPQIRTVLKGYFQTTTAQHQEPCTKYHVPPYQHTVTQHLNNSHIHVYQGHASCDSVGVSACVSIVLSEYYSYSYSSD